MKYDFCSYVLSIINNNELDLNIKNVVNFREVVNNYLGEFRLVEGESGKYMVNIVSDLTYSFTLDKNCFFIKLDEKDYSDLDNELIYFTCMIDNENNYFMVRAITVQDNNLISQTIYDSFDNSTAMETYIENKIYTNVINHIDFTKIDLNDDLNVIQRFEPDYYKYFGYEVHSKGKDFYVINDYTMGYKESIKVINPESYNHKVQLMKEISDMYLNSIGLKSIGIRNSKNYKVKSI